MSSPEHFNFEHVNLIPKLCVVKSRSECETKTFLDSSRNVFELPVVPANMECVIDKDIAVKLASHGYFYILHRFNMELTDYIAFCINMKKLNLFSSISVGVNIEAYHILGALAHHDAIPDYVTIDIAHGHSDSMRNLITWIKDCFKDKLKMPYIIAGNVSTPEAVQDLEKWGANAIKVGIGCGSACTTYTMTGFGSRNVQASCIKACAVARRNPNTKIIADGGIKEPGDIAKSLALGADMVMVGGMFSGLIDSPGRIVEDGSGRKFKEFWGSASEHQSGKKLRIEGTRKLIPLNERHYLEEMNYIKECLQSAISYAGGKNIDAVKNANYLVHY
jgi:GMP reductase